jgi:pentapeptide MXKDX repeat protein
MLSHRGPGWLQAFYAVLDVTAKSAAANTSLQPVDGHNQLWEIQMKALIAASALALFVSAAYAEPDAMSGGAMKSHDAMKGDAMKGDAMKGDAMKGGAMKGHDAMMTKKKPKKDAMKGDAMKGDAMKGGEH